MLWYKTRRRYIFVLVSILLVDVLHDHCCPLRALMISGMVIESTLGKALRFGAISYMTRSNYKTSPQLRSSQFHILEFHDGLIEIYVCFMTPCGQLAILPLSIPTRPCHDDTSTFNFLSSCRLSISVFFKSSIATPLLSIAATLPPNLLFCFILFANKTDCMSCGI